MKKFTYIVSLLMLIGGLLLQIFPQVLNGLELGSIVGVIFLLMSVFVLDNAKIQELQDKVEKLEQERKRWS